MATCKGFLTIATAAFVFAGMAEEEAAAEGGENAEAAKTEAASKPAAKPVRSAGYTALPFCRIVDGEAYAKRPGEEWAKAEEGRFYPLGTAYRTGRDGSLTLAFGPDSTVTAAADSEFATRAEALGSAVRAITLVAGEVTASFPDNMPVGAFAVLAPGFTVKNQAGDSKYTYENKGESDRAVVRCVTGAIGVEGRHFAIPVMRAADEVVLRTTRDFLMTELDGTSGDYKVKLDQGVCAKPEIGDDGSTKSVDKKAETEWNLSPKTRIVINRSLPSIGERMSVHTMCFDAAGEMKSECCFCEGRAEINSGELVPKEKSSADELAKRAAEATETTEAADEEASDGDEKKEEKKEEKTEASSDSSES